MGKEAVVYSFRTGKALNNPTVVKKRKIRWKRLFIALAVVSIFLYGAISLVINAFGLGFKWIDSVQERAYMNQMAQYEQVRVVVGYGDTAWDMQKRLTPNEDVREMLSLTSTLNPGVKLGNLQSGDVITMFKEKAE